MMGTYDDIYIGHCRAGFFQVATAKQHSWGGSLIQALIRFYWHESSLEHT